MAGLNELQQRLKITAHEPRTAFAFQTVEEKSKDFVASENDVSFLDATKYRF